MHKDELLGNRGAAKNISLLSGKFRGKRILIISTPIAINPALKIRNYFDIIVVEGLTALTCYPKPDIFIYSNDSFYENGKLNENMLDGLNNTLCCVNTIALQEAGKIRMKLSAPILGFSPHAQEVIPFKSINISGISMGLAAQSPGLHLSLIAGAVDIYDTTPRPAHATYLDDVGLAELVYKKGLYGIPTNIRSSNRQDLIDSVIW